VLENMACGRLTPPEAQLQQPPPDFYPGQQQQRPVNTHYDAYSGQYMGQHLTNNGGQYPSNGGGVFMPTPQLPLHMQQGMPRGMVVPSTSQAYSAQQAFAQASYVQHGLSQQNYAQQYAQPPFPMAHNHHASGGLQQHSMGAYVPYDTSVSDTNIIMSMAHGPQYTSDVPCSQFAGSATVYQMPLTSHASTAAYNVTATQASQCVPLAHIPRQPSPVLYGQPAPLYSVPGARADEDIRSNLVTTSSGEQQLRRLSAGAQSLLPHALLDDVENMEDTHASTTWRWSPREEAAAQAPITLTLTDALMPLPELPALPNYRATMNPPSALPVTPQAKLPTSKLTSPMLMLGGSRVSPGTMATRKVVSPISRPTPMVS
jgi:hypothetical protein